MLSITKVITMGVFQNGDVFEYEVHPNSSIESIKILNDYVLKKKIPVVDSRIKIIYTNGSEYILPISDNISPLKSGKEFLVIFDKEPSCFSQIKEPPWYFPPPNNAAIYYSDGTLKHQLISPIQDDGWYIDRTWYMDYPEGTWRSKYNGFGFIIANDSRYPQGVFCLYNGTPNLVLTGYEIDRSR
ncbi:hypothetical protein NKT77_08390 [Moraxella sp. FZLJ2107]|uniref:hypothetical protein n=1 Tax=unclassified Moraxella TaxID=2685852 RepID=UPI0020C8B0EA|nr:MULTISPECIES: hypothetical protein [unclassified Moraxella]UTO04528.1 hypothetical protein NKT77_08390 [Moraxella sp. FZLJ2107]UTO23361.1 hypothetical protein NKU06_05175 [Moraxella sp. FZLJ2109]